ncbi:MAG: Ldh family oxidoreductase, partial [Candidatus Eremiobacteraeota bacterium]|nr:Ldh family oxidoreductase [Candidatus Eremiobacteraeota bacterium]
VLSGGMFGRDISLPRDGPQPGKISHFFAAFKIDGFRDPEQFKADMDRELRSFKDSAKAPGHDRIYVAGEIEHEKFLAAQRDGVPIHVKVWDGLEQLAANLGVPFDFER